MRRAISPLQLPLRYVHRRVTDDLLDQARRIAGTWLRALPDRHAGPLADASTLRLALDRPCTAAGEAPHTVLDDLARDLEPGLVASGGPRYHGFVVGGALPVALAADWLVSAYDQMAGMHSSSPGMAVLEEISAAWVLDLLGLPPSAGVGFVTGAQMANVTCLAVARNSVLAQEGWDVRADGLIGAPAIEVLVGEEAHVTVGRALRLIGLGEQRVTRVPIGCSWRSRTLPAWSLEFRKTAPAGWAAPSGRGAARCSFRSRTGRRPTTMCAPAPRRSCARPRRPEALAGSVTFARSARLSSRTWRDRGRHRAPARARRSCSWSLWPCSSRDSGAGSDWLAVARRRRRW